jgi:hypothetical protein
VPAVTCMPSMRAGACRERLAMSRNRQGWSEHEHPGMRVGIVATPTTATRAHGISTKYWSERNRSMSEGGMMQSC